MRVSTEFSEMDVDLVHNTLKDIYWSKGIPREIVEKAMKNSINFGVFDGPKQLAYGRIITDRATFAYMADVFVIEERRGQGIGTMLVEAIIAHPDLQGLRRFCLMTKDAHSLYARYGFKASADPSRYMEIFHPYLYTQGKSS